MLRKVMGSNYLSTDWKGTSRHLSETTWSKLVLFWANFWSKSPVKVSLCWVFYGYLYTNSTTQSHIQNGQHPGLR